MSDQTMEGQRSFMFVDGLGADRRSVQSFINTDRLWNNALRKRRAAQSIAPIGWATRPQYPSLPKRQRILSRRTLSGSTDTARGSCQRSSATPQASRHLPTNVTVVKKAEEVSEGESIIARPLLKGLERDLVHVDPFGNLPLDLDPPSQALYCFSTVYLTDDRYITAAINPALTKEKGLFIHYESEIRLCLTLAAASGYLDTVDPAGQDTSAQTIYWRSASMRCLNRLIADPATRYCDDVLMGILVLLQFASSTPNSEQSHVHSRAMVQLLSHRNTLGNPEPQDHYMNVCIAVSTTKAQVTYLDHLRSGLVDMEEVQAWKSEVVMFIGSLKGLSSWLQDAEISFRDYATNCDDLTDLNTLLSQWIDIFHPRTDEFECSNQIFVLFSLALSLQDHRTPQACTHFLQLLSTRLRLLGTKHQLQNAVWVCIQGVDEYHNYKREAIHLARVWHRLSEASQERVKDFLFGICRIVTNTSPGISLPQNDYMTIAQEALTGVPGD